MIIMETDHTLMLLQNYWWLLISVLGTALVFLLFVQGGQSLLACTRNPDQRNLMVNSIGSKWELTFTTLVVFGGAFFASFPLFYSTSFGGAYWLWMLILFTFVGQAVSFQYRRKEGNIYGTRFFDTMLIINGTIGVFLLGEAVSMMFFGGDFTVDMTNILNADNPVISRWGDGHGWESILNWKNWALGLTVFFLARTQGALYFINDIRANDGGAFYAKCRKHVTVSGSLFVVSFLIFMALLLASPGLRATGFRSFDEVPFLYLHNYIEMWWCGVLLLLGVVMALYGIGRTALSPTPYTKGIWWSGIGTSLVVLTLFWVAGYNGTAYYPSLSDPASSLTIANSSSTTFTLKIMSLVSILVPFVIAYIAIVWRRMNRTPLTPHDINTDSHSY